MNKKDKIIAGLVALVILFIGFGIGFASATPHFGGRLGENSRGVFHFKNDYRNDFGNSMMMDRDGHMGMMFGKNATGTYPIGMNMADMMSNMNFSLKNKTGDEFDQAFLAEMIVHHQGAVQMAELALKQSKHQEIKDLAGAIITAQNKEIADMKSWLKAWYNK